MRKTVAYFQAKFKIGLLNNNCREFLLGNQGLYTQEIIEYIYFFRFGQALRNGKQQKWEKIAIKLRYIFFWIGRDGFLIETEEIFF